MKKLPLFFILNFSFLICFLAACDSDNYVTFSGFAQGTTYTVAVRNPSDGLGEKIDATFAEADSTFSIFNHESLTSRINRNETDAVTPLFERCFALAKDVHARTEGFFDPTVKPLVDAWGFGNEAEQEIPAVDAIMQYVGFDKIRIETTAGQPTTAPAGTSQPARIVKSDPRVQLDFSSIAKGLTVDLLAELLEGEQITDYMVEVGGEVRTKGVNDAGKAWRIGIDKPILSMLRVIEAVAVPTDALPAIATSGNYRNRFTDASGRTRVHTINPLTGLPTEGDILSVSIAANECALADAWATGLMASHTIENVRRILAANEAVATPSPIEYYIIYSTPAATNETFVSGDFPLEGEQSTPQKKADLY